jgi:phospholipid transport system substrate-binding protein
MSGIHFDFDLSPGLTRRSLGALAVAALLSVTALPAAAAPAETASPGGFIESLGDKVIAVLKDVPADAQGERAKALNDLFRKSFDVNRMAQFAAGLYWRRTDPDQRKAYVRLFSDYVAALYAAKFANYSGQRFVIQSQHPSSMAITAVRAEIASPTSKTPIEFRVRKTGEGYRIVDVYVGGVSLLITKRDEFNTVLAREGMEGLLQRLRNTATASG